ncbi:transmembrane amino acid transporter protein-domain-containing protein [Pterulicium gracile]|uniref:Transmembrane amino acid transporter protein-domain-containing protein n=1 Tax=Pterulicium gracile TaxID=1884261 RepID=A0A5C3R1F4_9AGAR|nr:transmembrane amino acid transporter protein-domain-containing protein [Pterula gracilis]
MTSLPTHTSTAFVGSASSSYSVRDAFESYRRAQFIAAEANTTSDHSDAEDFFDDAEAQARSALLSDNEDSDDDDDASDIEISDGDATPRPGNPNDRAHRRVSDLDDFDALTPTDDLYPSATRTTQQQNYFPDAAGSGIPVPGSRPRIVIPPPHRLHAALGVGAGERTGLLRKNSSSRSAASRKRRRPSAPASHPSWKGPQGAYGAVANDSDKLSDQTELDEVLAAGKSTYGQTLFNAIAILVGIGMLSEPLAFVHAGWLTGTVLIVFYGFITCYTAKILAGIIRENPRMRSYSDICRLAFGPRSSLFISLFFCVELFAVSVVLITLYADSASAVLPIMTSNTYKLVGFFILLPTLFLPLSLLSYASIIGILSTVLLVCVIFYDGLTKFEAPGSIWSPAETSLGVHNVSKVGISFGLFMAGFSGHAVMPSLARDMANPEDFNSVINWAFAAATLIYTLIGYAGYAMFGENVSEEVSMDLIKTPGFNPILNQITLWMLVISPLTKFALATQPMNVTLENLLGLTAPALTVEVQLTRQAYQPSGTRRTHAVIKRTLAVLQRVVLTSLAVAVAISVPDFSVLMGFIGSFSAFGLAVIIPILAKILIDRSLKTVDAFLLLLSFAMAIWGTVSAFLAASGQ